MKHLSHLPGVKFVSKLLIGSHMTHTHNSVIINFSLKLTVGLLDIIFG